MKKSIKKSNELYVPLAHLNEVIVIDINTNEIIKNIPINDTPILPLGSRPTVLTATLDGQKIYTDNFGLIPTTISVIDRQSNTVKSIIINGVPLGTFLSIDGKELYVSENNKSVEVICTKTDKIIRRLNFYDVPVACMGGPDGNLYIGFANGFLGVYDSENGETIREPIFTGGTLPAWYTFSSDRNKLYVDVVCSIGVIDIKEWKLIKSISTKNNREDDSWAFTSTLSPNGDKLYVTLLGDKGVLVIDTKTDTIISEIETAGSATCVTFSSDGRYGYISDMGPSLSYLKGPSGGTILGTAWVGFGIIGNGQIIIFDPISDKIIGEPISVGPTPGITVCLPSID